MIYYDIPAPYAAGLEQPIVDAVHAQIGDAFAARVDVSRHRIVAAVSVLASTEGVVRALERLYRERGVTFDVRVPEGVEVLAAREDLDEVLGNVLENACQWARTSCRVEARVDAGRVLIVIDDDGPGIPSEVRDRLPARGLRADETSPGSGLGLSIAHDLAQAYGGHMSLEDSPLGGLRVVIDLPSAR